MSCYFSYKGNDLIVGFNFDIEESFDVKVRVREDFVYGLYKENDQYIVPFGVCRDGNFGGFLNVAEPKSPAIHSYTDADIVKLTEDYIYGKYSFNDVINLLSTRPLSNPIGKSFHAMFVDSHGKTLILEPDRGVKQLDEKKNILCCFSYFEPYSTKDLDNSGYDTYQMISSYLDTCNEEFSVIDAFKLLKELKNDGPNPTRVSMVYSSKARCVYWALDSDFDNIHKNQF